MADILQAVAGIQVSQIFEAAAFLKNPVLAGIYLSIPYLFMIGLDMRSRKRRIKEEKTAVEAPRT
jgi:hypothetical protein